MKIEKIGMDFTSFTSAFQGGKDQVAYTLLSEFYKTGFTKNICCICHKDLVPIILNIAPDVEIQTIPDFCFSLTVFKHTFKFKMYGLPSDFLRISICKRKNLQCIFFTNKLTTFLPYRIPKIVIPHDIQDYLYDSSFPVKLAYRWSFKNVNRIVSISDFDKNMILKAFPNLGSRITQIYNPIVFNEPVYNALNGKNIVALNIGHPHKNALTILDAFIKVAKQTDYTFYLIGEPSYSKNRQIDILESIEKSGLQDRIIITGHISNEKLSAIKSNTRLYVNASSFEGFGMAAIEMMGSGIPAVVPDNSAQKEVTAGFARYYRDAKNSDELASTILEELSNPKTENELKEIAQAMRNRYSSDVIAKQYEELLMKTC